MRFLFVCVYVDVRALFDTKSVYTGMHGVSQSVQAVRRKATIAGGAEYWPFQRLLDGEGNGGNVPGSSNGFTSALTLR